MVDYTEGAGYEYHTHIAPGDVGRYVLLTGDPGRCEEISKLFRGTPAMHRRKW